MSTASTTKSSARSGWGTFLTYAQRVGRSLMLPIAVLPAAALLTRLGAADMLGDEGLAQFSGWGWLEPVADIMGAAGGAILGNLPILFAIGVAVGFAKKSDGSTALAGLVGFLVFTGVTEAMSPYVLGEDEGVVNFSVFGGILMGIVAAILWQRYHRIKLPPYLAFFGGRRFVPIITGLVATGLGVIFGLIWPYIGRPFNEMGQWIIDNQTIGAGVYGVVNRLLLPMGLHHIPNSLVWFQFGEFEGATGDLHRFFAGDPTAGGFMTGFFPIMMFALPAAALAIWHTARPAQKKIVGGIMLSAGLTSFITGVTEPIEFSFLFVAYPLYFIHAVLTGSSLALVNALGIRDGFGFSAGAIDYLLNFRIAELPALLIVIGLGYAAIYYFLFRWVITKWNLKTPGREEDAEAIEASLGEEGAAIAAGKEEATVAASSDADDDLPPIIDQPSDDEKQ
jgi:N-acetylglucosamine PTS system EIICBA or EIICB component